MAQKVATAHEVKLRQTIIFLAKFRQVTKRPRTADETAILSILKFRQATPGTPW